MNRAWLHDMQARHARGDLTPPVSPVPTTLDRALMAFIVACVLGVTVLAAIMALA